MTLFAQIGQFCQLTYAVPTALRPITNLCCSQQTQKRYLRPDTALLVDQWLLDVLLDSSLPVKAKKKQEKKKEADITVTTTIGTDMNELLMRVVQGISALPT
jgi:hypothetical protein